MIDDQAALVGGLLADCRVLDLSDEQGLLCGRLLADLGAEVIAVEPPGGNPSRRIGPFYKGTPDPERSLFWYSHAINKKSITLDLDSRAGRALFVELIAKSDVVVETFPQGHLDARGLGHQHLLRINPALVVISITPFGESGPYRDFKASDLVHWALGGMLYLCGDADRPPVRVSCPQSYAHAGSQAAIGALAALYDREVTGVGQVVSVAVHDCIPPTTLDAPAYWDVLGFDAQRVGTVRRRVSAHGVVDTRMVFPCKDGHVVILILGGQFGEAANRELSEWMVSEGIDLAPLAESGWPLLDFANITPGQMAAVSEAVAAFAARHTKAELYDFVFERSPNVMLVPVSSAKDLREDPHLKARGFWVQVEHESQVGTLTYPGPWAAIRGAPQMGSWRRAPQIGEHNAEIYGGLLGRSREGLDELRRLGTI